MHAFVKSDVRLTVIPPCAEYYEYSIIVIRFTIYSQYDLLVRYPIDRKKSFECCKRNEANKIFRSCMETKKRSRERLPFSEDLWRLLCVLIFIFLLFFFLCRVTDMIACTSGASAAIASATAFTLLFANDRRHYDRGNNCTGSNNDENFIPDHFRFSREAAASDWHTSSVPATMPFAESGCFLFHMTIPKIAAAMRTAKMKHVHHHDPTR